MVTFGSGVLPQSLEQVSEDGGSKIPLPEKLEFYTI